MNSNFILGNTTPVCVETVGIINYLQQHKITTKMCIIGTFNSKVLISN